VIDWVPENPIRSLAKWIYGKLELMFFFIFCQIYAKFENFSMLKLLNINQKKPKNMILSTPDPSLHIFLNDPRKKKPRLLRFFKFLSIQTCNIITTPPLTLDFEKL